MRISTLLTLLVCGIAAAGPQIKGEDPPHPMPDEPMEDERMAMSTDTDRDGLPNGTDNCVSLYNPAQLDGDGDEVGDTCDLCPDQAAFGEPYGCPYDTKTAARPTPIKQLEARIRAEQLNPPCAVEASLSLEDPDWTPASKAPTTLKVWLTNTTMKPITVTWSDGCPCGGVSIGSLSGLPPADEASCAEVTGNRLRCEETAGQCNPERELPSLTLEPGKATAFPETLVLQRDGHGCDYGPLPKTGGPAEYSVSVAPGLSGPLGGWRHPATRVKMPAPPVACPSDTPLVIPGGG